MDHYTLNKLHLQPKSDEELHAALGNFEVKWQHKARRLRDHERISRF